MRAIITITEYPSMPGRHRWRVKALGADYNGTVPGHGPEGAAAQAMEAAIMYGGGGYAIFAPAKVLNLIPLDMRSKS